MKKYLKVQKNITDSPQAGMEPSKKGAGWLLGNALGRRFIAGLAGIEFCAANLAPDTLKCLLQIALWHHIQPSTFLSFSRQRPRVGPTLATGIPNLFAISA